MHSQFHIKTVYLIAGVDLAGCFQQATSWAVLFVYWGTHHAFEFQGKALRVGWRRGAKESTEKVEAGEFTCDSPRHRKSGNAYVADDLHFRMITGRDWPDRIG